MVYFAQFVEPIDQIKLDPNDHQSFEWFTEQDVIDRKDEVVADEFADPITGDDPEYLITLRGFDLLGGGELRFG